MAERSHEDQHKKHSRPEREFSEVKRGEKGEVPNRKGIAVILGKNMKCDEKIVC